MTTKQRLILAVPTLNLPEELHRTTFQPMHAERMWTVLSEAGLWLGPRSQLEQLPQFKQIIPYVLLRFGEHFVHYTRTASGAEERLHGRMSVGLGGHVDLEDIKFSAAGIELIDTVEAAASREVEEELGPVRILRKRWIGLLVDNNNAVGAVHIGAVALWDLSEPAIASAEDAIDKVGVATLRELLGSGLESFETWSTLLLQHLASDLADA